MTEQRFTIAQQARESKIFRAAVSTEKVMNQNPNPFELWTAEIRRVVREEIKSVMTQREINFTLLTPEQLAEKLQVPVTWIYEQSRQDKLPTHRIGKYIRFDLAEVLASQNGNGKK